MLNAHIYIYEIGVVGQMSSNRYVKHNFGSTYSALHALNFYGRLYQSSHIVSNSRWDKKIPDGTRYDI